ncbi:hypothetical protein [Lentilactobacillus buchneri]|uniref:hypothetical protein n=1 Tax=Lentilactobacillus buchneri TaxID=1581 RepID=UPI0021A6F0D6|nr:hypothetical protein [Lentilactobacillus buchneri]MCT2881931.1 hypothetical protein [Lentilactobacillus buchneri]
MDADITNNFEKWAAKRRELEDKKLKKREPFVIENGKEYWVVRSCGDGYGSETVNIQLFTNKDNSMIRDEYNRRYIKKQCFKTKEEAIDSRNWLNLEPGQ